MRTIESGLVVSTSWPNSILDENFVPDYAASRQDVSRLPPKRVLLANISMVGRQRNNGHLNE